MHTTIVRPALRKQLQVETVAHTTGNIHEKHKHIFVFGVESLHLTAQYSLQLVVNPCQRPADHSATPTKNTHGRRQGMKPF